MQEEYEKLQSQKFLDAVRRADARMAALAEERQRLASRLELSGVSYDSERVSSSHVPKPVEEGVARMEELCADLDRQMAEYAAFRAEALEVIGRLDDPREYYTVYRRYFVGEGWGKCARSMSKSEQQVRRYHESALSSLYPLLPDGWL